MTAATLLDVIANTMPQSDPGSLKPEEYAAVTAYILQQNGYPAGAARAGQGCGRRERRQDHAVTPRSRSSS